MSRHNPSICLTGVLSVGLNGASSVGLVGVPWLCLAEVPSVGLAGMPSIDSMVLINQQNKTLHEVAVGLSCQQCIKSWPVLLENQETYNTDDKVIKKQKLLYATVFADYH